MFVLCPVGSLFLTSSDCPTVSAATCVRNKHSFWSKTTLSDLGLAESFTRDASRKYTTTFLIPLVAGSTSRVSCKGAFPWSVQISGSLFTAYGARAGGSPLNTNCPRIVPQPVPTAAFFSAAGALDDKTSRMDFAVPASAIGPRSTRFSQPENIPTTVTATAKNQNVDPRLFIQFHQPQFERGEQTATAVPVHLPQS